MSYFVNPLEQEQCVLVTMESEAPLQEAEQAKELVSEMLAARRWRRILVDVTHSKSVPHTVDLFSFGRGLSRGLPRGARIALVVRENQTKHAKLIENVARHNGTFLTFFTNPDQAMGWVRKARACASPEPLNLVSR